MKAAPLLVQWHDAGAPIFSSHFEPHGKGRLATAGGDNNVRLWKVEAVGEDRKVTYLSTLIKHTGTVNVVRWSPKGECIASAGDDGNILLWVPSEHQERPAFGEDGLEDKETWRIKHMFRSMGSEIYDLAWSPNGEHFITGSMDNVARIYDAQRGSIVRQIAEHNHFVQGVAWDPLNEYVATQSSDRSVHIYTLKTKEGQYTLTNPHRISRMDRMDLPSRRVSSSSPAPPDFSNHRASFAENSSHPIGSPVPSAPGTPQSLALPMNPPPTSHSRRSSFGSSPSMRRSVSPAPSLPLPAVMPGNSPSLNGIGFRNEPIYAGEDKFSSFFRRLTFAPDGSLLFTPAGQYRLSHSQGTIAKLPDEIINTVYIYTRAGLNKPPVAYLPGHKKPSIAVKCSPVYYNLRQGSSAAPTKQITVDTSSADPDIPALPEPALPSKATTASSSMDPPPFTSAPSPSPSMAAPSPKGSDIDTPSTSNLPAGPPLAFGLPYRMIYAVATADAVYVYDTQQTKPLCVVSNLHFTTFTDLTWANDGLTLFMSSSDGFCSCLTFAPGELGSTYQGTIATRHHPTTSNINTNVSSQQSTTNTTPVNANPPSLTKPAAGFPASPSTFTPARPASPARSMSTSSIASFVQHNSGDSSMMMNSTPTMGNIGSVAAAQSGPVPGNLPLWTPPETPMASGGVPGSGSGHRTHSASSSVSNFGSFATRRESEVESSVEGGESRKREADSGADDDKKEVKKRRVAPTQVVGQGEPPANAPNQPSASG
ncbi:WD40 repeat-like protein [Tothia fuscella]|uniref:WD40 repeat-like protein n=1 Tax=Tothia fuscella TaxID=1048955 RepID=A0A9P4U3D5_9PEZI|nr:WD40 repeat-like protein [Tothia fuscella]